MTDERSSVPPSLNARRFTVVRNAGTAYITFIISGVAGLIATPIVLGHLGTSRFGAWSLILSIVGYIALVETGIGAATVTGVASAERRGPGATSRVLSTSLALYSIIGACSFGLVLVVALTFRSYFDLPAPLYSSAKIALLLLGVWQALTFLSTVWTAALFGVGKYHIVTVLGVIVDVSATTAQILIAVLGGGLIPLSLTLLISTMVAVPLQRRLVRTNLPGVSLTLRKARRGTATDLLRTGSRNAVTFLALRLAFGSDLIVVGLVLTASSVAAYAVAVRGYQFARTLATKVADVILPAYAHVRSDKEKVFRYYTLSTVATYVVAIPFGIVFVIFGKPILAIWLGTVPPHSAEVLALLGVLLALQSPGHNAFALFTGTERGHRFMRFAAASSALNIGASLFFTAEVGVVGPALGSLTAVLLLDTAFAPYLVCREVGVGVARYLRTVVKPILLPTLCAFIVATACRAFMGSTRLLALPLGIAVAASFWIAFWTLSLSAAQRRRGTTALRNKFGSR